VEAVEAVVEVAAPVAGAVRGMGPAGGWVVPAMDLDGAVVKDGAVAEDGATTAGDMAGAAAVAGATTHGVAGGTSATHLTLIESGEGGTAAYLPHEDGW
jgi:hypothetical protein